MINSIGGSKGLLLQMTNYFKENFFVLLSMVIINLLLNFFLIPRYGMIGASFSSFIGIFIGNIIIAAIIKEKFGFYIFYIPLIIRGR